MIFSSRSGLTHGFHHRVGRVLSFSPIVGNGTPQPLTHRQVCPPPLVPGGGERRGGRVPIPTRGITLWYSVYVCSLWFPHTKNFFLIPRKVFATLIDSSVKTTAESQLITKPNLLVTATPQSHFHFR